MSEDGVGEQGEGLGDSEASWKRAGVGPAGWPPRRLGAQGENEGAGHGHKSMLQEGGKRARGHGQAFIHKINTHRACRRRDRAVDVAMGSPCSSL